MTTTFTIAHLAREARVNVETIHYYQRRGLIVEPAKPYSGFRVYPLKTVAQIKFIKRAKQPGVNLKEIAQLLSHGK